MELTATTRRLDADVDLIDVAGADGFVFENEGGGLAGRGVATSIGVCLSDGAAAAARVAATLGALAEDGDTPAELGPVAVGALPFARDAVGSLAVPEVLVRRADDGTRWVTTVGPPGHEPPLVVLPDDRPEPSRFDVRTEQDPALWCAAVESARRRLGDDVRKVVLARRVTVEADRPFPVTTIARRLRRTYPACTLYLADGFVGASPELLVSRQGDVVRSHPLAGTAARSGDPSADARLAAGLLASHKDREEHQITIDMVHDTLLSWCSFLDEEAEPSIVAMANVQHLGTLVEGRLSSPAPSVLELVAALHPTPAVGGDPRDRALDLIAELEPVDRGRYAGPVGWVDSQGNGSWVVGIRGAEIDGSTAHAWAGVGVVADSDPEAELAETRVKLQALLSALVRP